MNCSDHIYIHICKYILLYIVVIKLHKFELLKIPYQTSTQEVKNVEFSHTAPGL